MFKFSLIHCLMYIVALSAICMKNFVSSEDEFVDENPQNIHYYVPSNVLVQYCTTCGFDREFFKIQHHLELAFPHLKDHIKGENYPVEPYKKNLASFMKFAQMATMGIMIFGRIFAKRLGWEDTFVQKVLDKRLSWCALIFILGSFSQQMTASNAFEVYYNDELIYSRLQQGDFPTADEISRIMIKKGLLEKVF